MGTCSMVKYILLEHFELTLDEDSNYQAKQGCQGTMYSCILRLIYNMLGQLPYMPKHTWG